MSIELKSISCKGVKSLSLLQKPHLYVAASLVAVGDKTKRQLQRTPVDRDGGRNAEWSQLMRFDLGASSASPSLLLQFEVSTHGGILGDKVVGRVRIPVADLAVAASAHNHVSYQVRAPDGRPNGILRFAYKTVDPAAAAAVPFSPHQPPYPAPVFYPPPGKDPLSPPSPATSGVYPQVAETCSIYPPLPDNSPVYVPSSTWTPDSFYDSPKMSSVYPPPPPPPPPSAPVYPPPAPYGAFETPNSFYYPPQTPAPAAYAYYDPLHTAPLAPAYAYYDPPHTAPLAPAYAYSYGYDY